MAKIFLTGATGYIGGDILHRLASTSTKHSISCLVRSADKAKTVSASYPNLKIVQGDLSDQKIIEDEAQKSDIVLHFAATRDINSATAIQRGLEKASTKKPLWVQMSGATFFAGQEIANGEFGRPCDKTYDNLDGIKEVISTIEGSPKRAVDNLVISQDPINMRTALIVGPHIYGNGRGPVNQRSIQAPEIARITLKRKEGFRLLEGKNTWSTIHVQDVSDLVVSLIDAAAEGKPGLWNKEGVYLPESGSMTFGDVCAKIAAEAHKQGLVSDGSIKKVIDAKEADSLSEHASILWGTNAILRESRARSLLGWKPSRPSLSEEIPGIVQYEAQMLKQKL